MSGSSQELHPLGNFTGSSIKSFLTDLNSSNNSWAKGKSHLFCQGNENEPAIKIMPNPTPNQPGNGSVLFRQNDSWVAPKYSDPSIQNAVLNLDFRQSYNGWSSSNLSEANFQNPSDQAKFMLEFEQVRRVETSDDFLSRSQIANGINKVMGVNDQQYPTQVNRLFSELKNFGLMELQI